MAGLFWTAEVEADIAATKTVIQIEAPSNQRVKLLAVEIQPKGSTGATAPLLFDLAVQDGAGTSADGNALRKKREPEAVESIQSQLFISFSAEPSGNVPKDSFSLHQQSSRTWVPPDGPVIIAGGDRLGLRYLATTQVACKYRLYLEE